MTNDSKCHVSDDEDGDDVADLPNNRHGRGGFEEVVVIDRARVLCVET